MRYTYVSWMAAPDRWEAFCPAWPGLRVSGETQEDCLSHLTEKIGAQSGDLFCRGLPLPPDTAVQVGTLPALEAEGGPWAG